MTRIIKYCFIQVNRMDSSGFVDFGEVFPSSTDHPIKDRDILTNPWFPAKSYRKLHNGKNALDRFCTIWFFMQHMTESPKIAGSVGWVIVRAVAQASRLCCGKTLPPFKLKLLIYSRAAPDQSNQHSSFTEPPRDSQRMSAHVIGDTF
jgi:hypothetical protein